MNDMAFPGGLASLFNRHHKVGKDLSIDRDTELRSYQDDLDHSKPNLEAPTSVVLDADTDDDEDGDLTDQDD